MGRQLPVGVSGEAMTTPALCRPPRALQNSPPAVRLASADSAAESSRSRGTPGRLAPPSPCEASKVGASAPYLALYPSSDFLMTNILDWGISTWVEGKLLTGISASSGTTNLGVSNEMRGCVDML